MLRKLAWIMGTLTVACFVGGMVAGATSSHGTAPTAPNACYGTGYVC